MAKPQEDVAEKTLDPTSTALSGASNPPGNPNPRSDGEEKDDKKDACLKASNATVAALKAAVAGGGGAYLEKKLRRAERFGVAVQLSEEEKRRTRAERFGMATGSPLQRTKNGGNLEEQKRKARAERFGLAVHSPTDEEAKKKARLEQKPKPNALEEEKMKARAARFSQTSIIQSKTNSAISSEVKTAAAAIKEEAKGKL